MANFYYLYCLKDKTEKKFSTKGMDRKKVYTLPYRNIEAVITEVGPAEFDPEKIKLKLENLKWAEEKVRNHEAVIEEAMKDSPVIPLKFLTLYKSKTAVTDILKEQYKKFRELLNKLREKAEWGLKVYVVDKENLVGAIKKEDKEIVKMKQELTTKPEGVKYFLEKKMNEKILEKVNKQLDKYTKDIFGAFSPFSVMEPVINKLLPQELIGKGREMIFNVSFLIPKEKFEEFQGTIRRLHDYYFPKGLWIECNGPWPPYSFVTYEDKDKQSS